MEDIKVIDFLEKTEILKAFFASLSEEKMKNLEKILKELTEKAAILEDEEIKKEFDKINKSPSMTENSFDKNYKIIDEIIKIIEKRDKMNELDSDFLDSAKLYKEALKPYIAKEAIKSLKATQELIRLVELVNNEQINKKFQDVQNVLTSKKATQEEVIKCIEDFEESVKKNMIIEKHKTIEEKLNEELNEQFKVYASIQNIKAAIEIGDKTTFTNDMIVIDEYSKTLSEEDRKIINECLFDILNYIKKIDKKMNELTSDEIAIILKKVDELEKNIDIIKEKQKKQQMVKVEAKDEDIINAINNLKKSVITGKSVTIISHIRALKYAIEQIKDNELKEKMLKKMDSINKRINGVGYLTEGTKKQTIKELEELEDLYKNKIVEKNPNKTPKPPVTVIETPKTKKKKGKKVVAAKSAEPFYKRHKKGLLVAFGITLLAVSLPHLLPSIMYLHSALWGVAVASGVPANVGLPMILHDLNAIIGAKIGASYAASSGIWTLANGAALNATAAEAGILSVLGRLTTIALPFAGAKIAIKNAIKAAKEKIAKRKEKIEKEHPERKGHFFKNIKDYAKNKFNAIKENVTTKYTEAKEKHEKKKEEKSLEKERRREERELELTRYIKNPYLSRKTNRLIQTLYDNEIIEQDLFDELKEVEDETEAYEMIKKALKEEKGKGSK